MGRFCWVASVAVFACAVLLCVVIVVGVREKEPPARGFFPRYTEVGDEVIITFSDGMRARGKLRFGWELWKYYPEGTHVRLEHQEELDALRQQYIWQQADKQREAK